ncbi:response regulator [Rhizobium sp. CG4]|nr:response regulator [Rhizobium sp. CG4]MCS4243123.1 two-component system response regulator RegA [Rhizobium sp. BIGb0125]
MDQAEYVDTERVTEPCTVIIADPFVEKTASIAAGIRARGMHVLTCTTLRDALSACHDCRPSFVLTELRFPDGLGLELVKWTSAQLPKTRTVVHTWFADLPTAVIAAKMGACDFVPKPTDKDFLLNILLLGSRSIAIDCRIERADRIRQEHIEHVMRFNSANISRAARYLHLDRRSLQRMLKRYEAEA